MKSEKKPSIRIKYVLEVITGFFVAILLLLAVLLAGTRFIGFTPYAVISGSMEPKYPVGSMIYVQAVEPSSIRPGDPITFVLNEDLLVATHRVVEVLADGSFITKGDANSDIDGKPVHPNNLLGKPIFSIPYIGYLSVMLSTVQGKVMLAVVALVLLISLALPGRTKPVRREGVVD